MNTPYLLAKRIRQQSSPTFSATVMKVGIASVAVGVAILLVAFAVLYGFKNTIKHKLTTLSAHIHVSKITANRSFEETPFERNSKTEQIIQELPTYKAHYPVVTKAAILKSTEEIGGILVKGITSSYPESLFKENLVSGRWLSQADTARSKELLLSKNLANRLKIDLNSSATLYFVQQPPRARKLQVVGLYETGIPEFDGNLVIADMGLMQRLNNWDSTQIGHYEILTTDPETTGEQVERLLNKLPPELEASDLSHQMPQFFEWFKLLDRNILIVLVLILVVAAFNMVSVLLILIMERTPMIGILKAVGMNNREIRKIFLLNGVLLIVKGLFWGNLFGLLICGLQYYFKLIPLDPDNYYMRYIPIEIHWPTVLLINLFVLLLVSIALWLPTKLTLNIKPVDAIKYKD